MDTPDGRNDGNGPTAPPPPRSAQVVPGTAADLEAVVLLYAETADWHVRCARCVHGETAGWPISRDLTGDRGALAAVQICLIRKPKSLSPTYLIDMRAGLNLGYLADNFSISILGDPVHSQPGPVLLRALRRRGGGDPQEL
jgi:hypothetical protein